MNQIHIIRSNRKSISVEIKKDLKIIVRAPIRVSQERIDKFIKDKTTWIEKHLEIVKKRNLEEKEKRVVYFTDSELKSLKKQATLILPPRVNYFANLMGVKYNRITIRVESSRWGSCSARRNLNFNCLLALCPEYILEYVVIHELCHLEYMNHSKLFWQEVAKYCPNYKLCNKWLKINGRELIRRLG